MRKVFTLESIQLPDGCFVIDTGEIFSFIKSLEVPASQRHDSRFTVMVDGDLLAFKTIKKLDQTLQTCRPGTKFEVFRNFDKGVTIKVI